MNAVEVISSKRDGKQLTGDQLRFMIDGYTNGSIPDYQMAAWSMAVLCRGMDNLEIAALTDAMTASGTRLSRVTERPRVDKHSTGGLGDKTSLILAPLLACCDLDVPMLSGRGLGITGGTLDKLESFPGFRCDLSENEIEHQLRRVGCTITGTTATIAPADRKLYALRDVTGTVPSIALITASIMSKKIAESLDALVLDVKFGSAAFMQSLSQARILAESLIGTGTRMGVPTFALLSDMNQPLGCAVGNACEVNEAIEVLSGSGPRDVRDLTLELSSPLLVATGRANNRLEARKSLNELLDGGQALQRFEQMVVFQGGTFSTKLPMAPAETIEVNQNGFIASIDGQLLGFAVIELGGGRKKLGDTINSRVGLDMLVKVGDQVAKGQPLVRVYSDDEHRLTVARMAIERAIVISDQPVKQLPLIVS